MRAVVIGGGFAGMAAACRLAGDGHTVTVVEKAPRLGGRAASFKRDGETLDYGHHVLLRACTAAQGFLTRIGVPDAVSFQESLAVPLLFDGQRWVLRSWQLPGVTHLVPGLLGYRPLSGKERVAAARAGLALWASRSAKDETFAAWLARHGQTERAIRRLWDPIVVATLNAPPSAVSLRAARKVFRDAFFVPHGADMGLFTAPLGDVFDAARRYLEARGGSVEIGTLALAIAMRDGHACGVRLEDGREICAEAVISAVPPDALASLADGLPELAATIAAAGRLAWSPIVNVHLAFDRDVLLDPFAVGIDSPVQAVFRRHRPVEAGAGVSTLAAPSAPHKEGAAVRPRDSQALVLSQSSASDLIDLPDDEIVARLGQGLRDLLPAARDATLVDALVLRHRRATFIASPGSEALRPKARTAIPGLYLAGDWTATGWPSTIESAVLSGVLAAAAAETDAAACRPAAEHDAETHSSDRLAAERAEEHTQKPAEFQDRTVS